MKTIYLAIAGQWLAVVWLMSLTLATQAQTTTPPVLQWQRVIEGGIDDLSRARAAKSATGEFGVVNGTTFTHLTTSGAVKASDATARRASGVASTIFGGFFILVNAGPTATDNTLYLKEKKADGTPGPSFFVLPTGSEYQGTELIQSNGGRGRFAFRSISNHFQTGFKPRLSVGEFRDDGLQTGGGNEPEPEPVLPGSPPSGTDIYKSLSLPDGGYIQVGATGSVLRRPWPELAYAVRFSGRGERVWAREYSSFPAIFTDVILNPDGSGSFLVVANTGAVSSILPNGDLAPGTVLPSSSPSRNRVAAIASDGTGQPAYVVLSENFSTGRDLQLRGFNQYHQEVWSRTLGGSGNDSPQTVLATGDGYLLVGTTNSTDGDVQGKQGNALATWVVKLAKTATPLPLAITQPTYNCQTGDITINTSHGDGSPITYSAPGIVRGPVTSNVGTVEQGLRNDPKPIVLTATQNGFTASYTFDFSGFCANPPPVTPPTGGALALTQPTYDCATGAITFNTSGGDGSLITFSAPGISRSSATSNTGTVEQGLRNDPKPITITASQNGQTVSYTFDFKAYCTNPQPPTPPTPPVGTALALLAPAYDCATGAITFRTSGGNGSSVEYASPGITGWTTNPNQFVDRDARTANDVKPFTLMARQNGVVVTYTWDLKAACGRGVSARLGAGERTLGLSISVLGNPIEGRSAAIEIMGVAGQAVHLNLVDLQGRMIHQQRIEQAGMAERVSVPLGDSNGLLLLNVSTATQRQQVKLLKP